MSMLPFLQLPCIFWIPCLKCSIIGNDQVNVFIGWKTMKSLKIFYISVSVSNAYFHMGGNWLKNHLNRVLSEDSWETRLWNRYLLVGSFVGRALGINTFKEMKQNSWGGSSTTWQLEKGIQSYRDLFSWEWLWKSHSAKGLWFQHSQQWKQECLRAKGHLDGIPQYPLRDKDSKFIKLDN